MAGDEESDKQPVDGEPHGVPGDVLPPAEEEASVGRKRDRDSESASAAANTGDKESPNLSDSPGGTPVGTPGLVPQKKPRLTFGGGLRAISASQALEKKKLDPNSPATPGPISSPHPTSGDGGNAFAPPGDSQMSPLGGPAAAPDSGASLSLGAAAIEVQKSDKPRLVFPAAAKIAPPTEEKPKPKLTFGGGLSGAVPLKSSAPIAASSGLPEPSEPVPKPAGSSGELQWPAAASSSSASLAASGASHASLPQHRPSLSKPQLSQGMGGRTGGAAAHLEALSDSDGEGEARRGKSKSTSPRGGPASSASAGGAEKGLQGRTCDANSGGVGSRALSRELSKEGAVADALEQGAASGVGGGSVDGAGAGGVDEGGKEKDVSEQVLPSSEELLAKIQVVDDAIAATDAAIANLQADALQGEGAIFGMAAKRKASVLIFGSYYCPKLDEHGQEMLQHNNKAASKRLEAMAAQMDVPHHAVLLTGKMPLYTRVEDAPYYHLNRERHEAVKMHIEAHLRRRERERRRADVSKAVAYRRQMKAWLAANQLTRPRKSRAATIPALEQGALARRTRSAEKGDAGDGADDDDDCASSLAVVPDMIATHQERLTRASFRSHNGLVLDPVQEEIRRHYSNVWSEEEKQVFVEKLVDFSLLPESKGMKKNFHRISQHLPNKTTRDCVQFYYLNKKTKFFKVLYKKFEQRNRKSYSLKNKYRARDDTKERSTFADTYAFDQSATTTLACLDPTILLNKPDDKDDDQPDLSYQRPRKYVNYAFGR